VVPHCGTELPEDVLSRIDRGYASELAKLVHDNADTGTGAMYRTLVDSIISGESRGVAVAGFHISRLLLDANRTDLSEQVPPEPYVGSAVLYREYLEERGHDLREEALVPWLSAVNEIICEIGVTGVAYHHHTYDVVSVTPRPIDQGLNEVRPAFQISWEKPAGHALDIQTSMPVDGMAPLPLIQDIRDRIHEFLEVKLAVADGTGAVDYPLRFPLAPFLGTRQGDPPDLPFHVAYDLRKGILTNEELVRSWVVNSPWRLGSTDVRDVEARHL
jgi:hypothetical protein